jgi:hypothetical protein
MLSSSPLVAARAELLHCQGQRDALALDGKIVCREITDDEAKEPEPQQASVHSIKSGTRRRWALRRENHEPLGDPGGSSPSPLCPQSLPILLRCSMTRWAPRLPR